MRWRGRSPPSGESTSSLKFCAQSCESFVKRRLCGEPRSEFGIPARCESIPCGIPCDVAKALDLPAGLPVLMIRRVAFAYHDKPVEYRVSYVDTRQHDYVGDTHR